MNAVAPETSVRIPVAGARDLEGLLHLPAGGGPGPGLVIAPGSSYPKEGPIIESLARQAAPAGWVVLRFDWSYTTYGGGASGSRKREAAELEAALAFLGTQAVCDPNRLVVAGKSLGSAAAYQVFRSHPELSAAMLLTPVFRTAEGAGKTYAGLAQEARPVLLVTGDRDSLNKPQVMEAHLAAAGKHIVAEVVAGDHGLCLSRRKDPDSQAANRDNIDAAMAGVVRWLGRILPVLG